MTTFNPRTERIAAAAHYYASLAGWDITVGRLASRAGVSTSEMVSVLTKKRWLDRVSYGGLVKSGTSPIDHRLLAQEFVKPGIQGEDE